jgi:hypothetical protein
VTFIVEANADQEGRTAANDDFLTIEKLIDNQTVHFEQRLFLYGIFFVT